MANSTIKGYLGTGAQFTEMSKQQAEALVKSLVKSGEVRRKDAEQLVQSLASRGKARTEKVAGLVQAEVAKQLKAMSARFDEVEHKLEALAVSIKTSVTAAGAHGASAVTPERDAPSTAEKTATAATSTTSTAKKQATAKKPATKRTTAKKTTAKKSSTKKSTTKKSAERKSTTADAAVGTSGVRKVSTTRQP